MNARFVLCAALLGASLVAAPDAYAKGDRSGKNRRERIALTRPSDGTDSDAAGTVRREKNRAGDETVLQLSNLDPRTRYEVRDADTGETLGDVTTNRKGRAKFNMTRSLRKSAQAGGAEATDGEDVANVQIVKEGTDDCVLEGGVDEAAFENFAFGYEDYENEAGDAASVSMFSAPGFGDESFDLTLFPIQESFAAAFFTFHRDTLSGDELPLGVASVTELEGRGFQILTPEGAVLIEGDLPLLEDADFGWDDSWDDGLWEGDDGEGDRWADPSSGIWAGPNGDWWDTGSWDDVSWDDKEDWSWSDDWSDEFESFDPAGMPGMRNGGKMKSAKARRGAREILTEEPPAEEPVFGYTLRIEDENGDLQDAGVLEQILYDHPTECPWSEGDWDFGDGMLVGIMIFPFDGDFDWEGMLDDMFGEFDLGEWDELDAGEWDDWSDWGGADDLMNMAGTKHGRR